MTLGQLGTVLSSWTSISYSRNTSLGISGALHQWHLLHRSKPDGCRSLIADPEPMPTAAPGVPGGHGPWECKDKSSSEPSLADGPATSTEQPWRSQTPDDAVRIPSCGYQLAISIPHPKMRQRRHLYRTNMAKRHRWSGGLSVGTACQGPRGSGRLLERAWVFWNHWVLRRLPFPKRLRSLYGGDLVCCYHSLWIFVRSNHAHSNGFQNHPTWKYVSRFSRSCGDSGDTLASCPW